jgi:tetratricopeptide (TPR) repeat protein
MEDLAELLQSQGDFAGALQTFEASMAIVRQLAERDPANPQWQRDLSVAYRSIGKMRVTQGELVAALEAFEESMAIAQQLAGRDPANAQWQRDLSLVY